LRIQCVNNERQQGLGLQAFIAENHAYPLLISVHPWDSWDSAVAKELNSPFSIINNRPTGVFRCPAVSPRIVQIPGGILANDMDYGYNGFGLSRMAQSAGDPDSLGLGGHKSFNPNDNGSHAPPVSDSEVVSPSEMIAIGDAFSGSKGVILDLGGNISRNFDWEGYMFQSYLNYSEITKQCYVRHRGKSNVDFCDGHVESPTLKFLFEDTSDEALSRWNRDHLPHRERL
jgi:prepilin-type processing-associated H-X9-DG protein